MLGGGGRPGTLGVRPLTGSVAAADGRRRQGAETSVAHAAACPPERPLHVTALALFGTHQDAGPGHTGRPAGWDFV